MSGLPNINGIPIRVYRARAQKAIHARFNARQLQPTRPTMLIDTHALCSRLTSPPNLRYATPFYSYAVPRRTT